MRCRNFFSAAIRQGSGAWPPFLDNNSWICLFFTLALSLHRLVFPFHPASNPPFPFCLSSPTLLFCLFLCPYLPQRFVQRTVVAMAFVCPAPAAVTMAGWALDVTRGRVTLAAMNMALARMANVNAVRVGTENTALLVGWEEVLFWVGDSVCVYVCVFEEGLGDQQKQRLLVCLCVNEVMGVRGRVQLEKRGKSMLN